MYEAHNTESYQLTRPFQGFIRIIHTDQRTEKYLFLTKIACIHR